jgi:hypothetical protein
VTSAGGQLAPFQHPTFPRASNPQVVQNDEFSGCFNKPIPKTSPFSNGNIHFENAAPLLRHAPEPWHGNPPLGKRDVFLIEVLNSQD